MRLEDCPCKECKPPERNAKCHSRCEKYTAWKEDRDRMMAEREKRIFQKDIMGHSQQMAIWKKMRWR